LLVLNFLPKAAKFNQDYFIDTVLPNLFSEKRRNTRCKGLPSLSVHMDNSMCHNGAKITEKPEKSHIARAPHPSYSPDLSPYDFWSFGILKQKMKEQVSQSEEQILAAITESWNELTFDDIQRVFHNWMEHLMIPYVPWIAEEDSTFYRLVRTMGPKWKISSGLMPGRSACQVKNRWYSVLRTREEKILPDLE
jgi:transposase